MADNPNLTVERFRLALADFSMLPAAGRILVCVSGGQDSVALLHLLSTLPPGSREGLVVAHFNHRMREAADADEAFVAELARQLGCGFTRGEGDVYGSAQARGENVEVVGHELRYAFFADAAREHGCEAIALGHTGSDLAESLLMNILRGAGVDGLASIPPTNGPYIRPLVYITRAETEAYCTAHALAYRSDETNLDTDTTRNRVRQCLMPALEADYGPGVESALLRAALAARAEIEWTAPLVAEAADRCLVDSARAGTGIMLDVTTAAELPQGLLVRVLRYVCEEAGLPIREIGWEHCRLMANIMRDECGSGAVSLPGGFQARRTYNRFSISTVDTTARPEPFMVDLRVPGETELPGGRRIMVTEHIGRPGEWPEATGMEAVFDAAAVGGCLRVRSLRPGDRLAPLGMQGSKKVSDILVDAKVPVAQRAGLVCITDCRDSILWLPGLRMSRSAAITETTRSYYRVRLTQVGRGTYRS